MKKMSPNRILIVGGGVTGAATYHFLSALLPHVLYTVWEKETVIGGRMHSNIQRGMAGSPHCDMGAQYLTSDASITDFEAVYQRLLNENIVKPLKLGSVSGMRPDQLNKRHLVAVNGLGSVVSELLKGADVRVGHTLDHIQLSSDRQRWLAFPEKDIQDVATGEEFDAIIFTLPVPRLLEIGGSTTGKSFSDSLEEVYGNNIAIRDVMTRLSSVRYSSRYAVACHYPMSTWDTLATVPWTALFVPSTTSTSLRYVSIENRKCHGGGVGDEGVAKVLGQGPVLLLHSSIPFAVDLMREEDNSSCSSSVDMNVDVTGGSGPAADTDKGSNSGRGSDGDGTLSPMMSEKEKVVIKEMLTELEKVIPGLGLGLGLGVPSQVVVKHWQESQVSTAVTDSSGAAAFGGSSGSSAGSVQVDDDVPVLPVLGIAGDMFTESNFEGCLRSALSVAKLVTDRLK